MQPAVAIALIASILLSPFIVLIVMNRLVQMHRLTLRHLQNTQLYGGTPAGVARVQVEADIEAREREQIASIEERQKKADFDRDMYNRLAGEAEREVLS